LSEPKDSESTRLTELDSRIAKARDGLSPTVGAAGPSDEDGGSLRLALRVGTELVAALVVGLLIGWTLDRWLGTRPLLTIVFFFVGIAAGMVNVYRAMNGLGLAVGYGKPGRPGAVEDVKGTMAGTDNHGNERE
jgi:ATP synthase protein I